MLTRKTWFGIAFGVALIEFCPDAQADTVLVGLDVVECERAFIDSRRLVELIRTEIAPRTLGPAAHSLEPLGLTCKVTLCHGTADGALVQLYFGSDTLEERTVELSDVTGDSRARTLAVVVAELVAASERPGSAPSMTKPRSVAASTPHVLTPAQVTSVKLVSAPLDGRPAVRVQYAKPLTHLSAGVFARTYAKPGALFWGPSVGYGFGPYTAQAILLTSNTATASGDIRLIHVAIAPSLEFFTLRRGPRLGARGRAEFGGTWASGTAADARTMSHDRASLTTGIMLEVLLREKLVDHVSAIISAMSGYSGGLTAKANDTSVASTSGWFVSAALGFDCEMSQ